VASEEVGDMGFLLCDLPMRLLKRVVLLHPVEFVGVISGDDHDVVVLCVEGALDGDHGLALADALEGEALLLVPVPQNDFVAVLSRLY